MGKSSSIIEAVRRKRGARLVYADFLGAKTVPDIINRIVSAIITTQKTDKSFFEKVSSTLGNLGPVMKFDLNTGVPSFTVGQSGEGTSITASSIHSVFDFIELLDAGKGRIVVAFDEFQDIRQVEEGDKLLAEMRSRIQQQGEIAYFFAGSIRSEMAWIFQNPDSPFFKSVVSIDVGPIPQAHFEKFLRKRFTVGKRAMGEGVFDTIFELVEGSPSDVQQICHYLWNFNGPGDVIGKEDVTAALERIFVHERKGYEAITFPLTAQQMRCLRTLAKIGGKHPQSKDFLKASGIRLPASVKRSLQRLQAIRIVYGPELEYKFFDSFLKLWLRWKH